MAEIWVAMTTYCGERYVEKQLESILNQSRKADHVVICDDESTDNTAQIVASFIEHNCLSNWSLSVNNENLGYKKNFKKAIGMTRGDLVFLSDQDDIWLPSKLEKMETFFADNPECKSLNTSFEYIDENDDSIPVISKDTMSNNNLIKRPIAKEALEKIKFEEIVSYNITPGCTMGFTKEVREIYLNKTVSGGVHDWEINLISSILDGCYFVNSSYIQYRIHDNNAIGIQGVSKNSTVDRGSYNHRLETSKTMVDSTTSFMPYKEIMNNEQADLFHKQMNFVIARYNALKSKNIFKVLKINKYRKNYVNSVTKMGRLADIACVVK